MPTYTPSLITPGATSDADADVNNELLALANILNGALDASNLANLAVTLAKMAANSVDASKIVDGSVGPAEIAATQFFTMARLTLDDLAAPRITFVEADNADKTFIEICDGGTWSIREDTTAGASIRLSLGGTGKAVVSVQPISPGADVGLTIGSDTNLYRSAAGVLKTDGVLVGANGRVNEIYYEQRTTDLSVTATTEGTAQTAIAGAAVTYAAVPYMFEFTGPGITPPGGGVAIRVVLFEDGVAIGNLINENATGRVPCHGAKRHTPTAASHTYSVRAWVGSGTGTIMAGAGGATDTPVPAFLRVTRA